MFSANYGDLRGTQLIEDRESYVRTAAQPLPIVIEMKSGLIRFCDLFALLQSHDGRVECLSNEVPTTFTGLMSLPGPEHLPRCRLFYQSYLRSRIALKCDAGPLFNLLFDKSLSEIPQQVEREASCR